MAIGNVSVNMQMNYYYSVYQEAFTSSLEIFVANANRRPKLLVAGWWFGMIMDFSCVNCLHRGDILS